MAMTCAERSFGTIWGFSPLLQRDMIVGFMFGHSAVPVGILLINSFWKRLWDPGTFPFTMRSHVQVFGKFMFEPALDCSLHSLIPRSIQVSRDN